MKQTFEFVTVDIIFQLCQETTDQVTYEDHLSFQGTQNGEQD